MSVTFEINGESVEVSDEIIDRFERLEGGKVSQWTAEKDALLMKYWPVKKRDDVAELLEIPRTTCANRYKYLMKVESVVEALDEVGT